ncbi:unnamed protein product [Aureobasidium pullulans]|nr:unnamed protein product [Aureobasidium pullulans]CAD0017840.1 unnamed protein product [Aureobasidium pullulans]CAD0026417.1 unnamed protein product [Aureobasidium pullulans]CAD0053187.1 unnamed protein product [Aureobasidium pullulans]
MFRPIAILRPRTVTRTPTSFCTSTRLLAAKPKTASDGGENGDDELDAARRWLATFDAETIPKSICDVSFSRSSGPGGQNNENVHRCFIKLHEMIKQAGREVVPGETSAEQAERVKKLLKIKKKHSDKKSARRGGGKPDY